MIPILTPLVLGLVGYEYFKYSRNNEQIQILVNKVTYSNFQTIQDIYKLFGSSEGASLLNSIYDSIMSFDQSLVPTHYHHINFLKLSAIIPAAVVDYDIKGFVNGLKSSGFISEPYQELTKAFNEDAVKEPKPLKFISVEEAFKPVPLKFEMELYNGELFNKLSCPQDSYFKHYTCHGSRSPQQENPVSDSHKWIVKVPHVDEKTNVWWFQKGSDKIDLREFGVKCNDLAFSEVLNYGYVYGQEVSITDSVGQKHELEVTFENPLLHPTCEDFIFNAE